MNICIIESLCCISWCVRTWTRTHHPQRLSANSNLNLLFHLDLWLCCSCIFRYRLQPLRQVHNLIMTVQFWFLTNWVVCCVFRGWYDLWTQSAIVSLKFLHRGKCNVTLLNETDVLAGYLDKEVSLQVPCSMSFQIWCNLVQAKILLSRRWYLRLSFSPRIVSSTRWCLTPFRRPCWLTRVRSGWAPSTRQRSPTSWLRVSNRSSPSPSHACSLSSWTWTEVKRFFHLLGEADNRVQEKLETKVWDPNNQLKDPQIDQFLVVAR